MGWRAEQQQKQSGVSWEELIRGVDNWMLQFELRLRFDRSSLICRLYTISQIHHRSLLFVGFRYIFNSIKQKVKICDKCLWDTHTPSRVTPGLFVFISRTSTFFFLPNTHNQTYVAMLIFSDGKWQFDANGNLMQYVNSAS